MGKVTSGVFTCDNNKLEFEINEVYATPAELINFEITIDNNDENWTSYDSQGYENSLITGKGYSISATMKRVIGDACQEYLVEKAFKKGQDARGKVKVTLANGLTITDTMNIKVNNIGAAGEATSVAELEVECTHASGVPEVSQATE